MSPMGTSLAEMDGSPSEDMIAFYKARAIGGAALIIPEIARLLILSKPPISFAMAHRIVGVVENVWV